MSGASISSVSSSARSAAGSTHAWYRSDVDGLRALAVLPVLLFHAEIPGFDAGFIGVDIFFVISGYVITGMILREISRDRFSLVNFFQRRIYRLFPALFLVIIATTILCALLLEPDSYRDFQNSAVAAYLSVANFYFNAQSGYFATATKDMPLLHFWSLAVEEQFYLVWPLALLVIAGRKWLAHLPAIIIGTILLSFELSISLLPDRLDSAFYLLPPRMWELMLGALIAALPAQILSTSIRNVIAALGLSAIIVGYVYIGPEHLFPGWVALWPTVGTALLIWSGHGIMTDQSNNLWLNRLLSWRPLVAIGLISYGLYLWHFPLLTLGRLYYVQPVPVIVNISLLLLSTMLAIISYRYYEAPIRVRGNAGQLPGAFKILFLGILLGGAVLWLGQIYVERQQTVPMATAALNEANNASQLSHGCHVSLTGSYLEKGQTTGDCRHGEIERGTILIWGDSHAAAIAHGFVEPIAKLGLNLEHITKSSCPPIQNVEMVNDSVFGSGNCAAFNSNMLDQRVSDSDIKAIILNGRWSPFTIGTGQHADKFTTSRLIEAGGKAGSIEKSRVLADKGLTQTISSIRKMRGDDFPVFLIKAVPEPGFLVPRCVDRYGRTGRDVSECLSMPILEFHQRSASSSKILQSVSNRFDNVILLEPESAFCDDKICRFEKNNALIYRDGNHLSKHGAELLASKWQIIIRDNIGKP